MQNSLLRKLDTGLLRPLPAIDIEQYLLGGGRGLLSRSRRESVEEGKALSSVPRTCVSTWLRSLACSSRALDRVGLDPVLTATS